MQNPPLEETHHQVAVLRALIDRELDAGRQLHPIVRALSRVLQEKLSLLDELEQKYSFKVETKDIGWSD